MSDIRKPTVHLNGTSAETLFQQNLAAAGALRAAIAALHAAAPHGRDYYVQHDTEGDSYSKVRKEHDARVERLRSVLAEVEEIAEHAAEAMDSRWAERELARLRRGIER